MHFIDHRSRLPNTVFISYSATDQDLKQLPGLHYAADIRELRLQGGNFSDRALESVALLPGLERLWLEGEKFTDAGLEAVGRILTLRELRLSWTNVCGSLSPAIMASIMARPVTPRTSLITPASLTPAISRVFWIRCVWRAFSRDN